MFESTATDESPFAGTLDTKIKSSPEFPVDEVPASLIDLVSKPSSFITNGEKRRLEFYTFH